MDVGGIFAVFVVTTIVEIVFAWVNSRGKTESSDERAVQQQIASLQKEKNGVSRTRYCALFVHTLFGAVGSCVRICQSI